jgi:TonB family protein
MGLARSSLLWSAVAHAGLLVTFACLVGARSAKQRANPPLVRFEAFASEATNAAVPREAIECDVRREEAPLDAVVDWPEPDRADEALPAPATEAAEPCTLRERCRVAAAAMQHRVVAAPPAPTPPPPAVSPAATAPSAPSVRTLVPIAGTDQPPTYPTIARRRGWQGTVVLGIECDAAGLVQDVTVVRSSGHEVLDAAATAAVRQWRFAAGPGHCEQTITFRLQASD